MKTQFIVYNEHGLHLDCIRSVLLQNFDCENIFTVHCVNICKEFKNLGEELLFIVDASHYNSLQCFTLLDEIWKIFPNVDVLIIGKSKNSDFIKKLYKKGIKGYIDEVSTINELIIAINKIIDKKVFVSENVKKIIFESAFSLENEAINSNNKLLEDLTKRESQLLKLLCDGLTGKEIASQMFISLSTVESHKRSIMMKLNVHNSTRLVKFAIDNNIVA